MKPIWFAVFTSQLAFALAVFDIDQIVRAIRKSKTGTWEITENSVNEIEIQQITVKPEKIEFNNTKVYIVLKQEWITTSKYQIYYLVPEHSSISIRFKAVEYVIELRNILMAEKNKDIKINHISFIREIHNQESRKFRDIFPQLRKNQLNSPRRLYRFSNVNGKVRFQQVPLQFSKLNTSDTFIFDYPSSIILFNIKNRNADTSITSAAERIAKFIFFENGSYETFDLDQCRNWVPRKANCYSEFISKLEGCPEPENVIQKMLENEVEEIPDDPNYKIYSPSENETEYNMEPEFFMENLESPDFMTKLSTIPVYL